MQKFDNSKLLNDRKEAERRSKSRSKTPSSRNQVGNPGRGREDSAKDKTDQSSTETRPNSSNRNSIGNASRERKSTGKEYGGSKSLPGKNTQITSTTLQNRAHEKKISQSDAAENFGESKDGKIGSERNGKHKQKKKKKSKGDPFTAQDGGSRENTVRENVKTAVPELNVNDLGEFPGLANPTVRSGIPHVSLPKFTVTNQAQPGETKIRPRGILPLPPKQAATSSGKKSKQPITFNLFDVLEKVLEVTPCFMFCCKFS